MSEALQAAKDIWWLLSGLGVFLGFAGGRFLQTRDKARDTLKDLRAIKQNAFDEKGHWQLMTVSQCIAARNACSGSLCGKVDDLKQIFESTRAQMAAGMDDFGGRMEKRIKDLHEKREHQDRRFSETLQNMSFYIGQLAERHKLDPPPGKGITPP